MSGVSLSLLPPSPQLSAQALNKQWSKKPQEMIGLVRCFTLPAHTRWPCVRGCVGLYLGLTHSQAVSRPFHKTTSVTLFP